MRIRLELPELGGAGLVLLSIIALFGGVIFGTHQPWYYQIAAVVVGVMAIKLFAGHLELGALAYFFLLIIFAVGCVIGDISWAIQTDTPLINFDTITNPFVVEE